MIGSPQGNEGDGFGKVICMHQEVRRHKFIDQFKVFLLGKKGCWIIKKLNECGLICNYLRVFNWKLYP